MKTQIIISAVLLANAALVPAKTWGGATEAGSKIESLSRAEVKKQLSKASELKKLINEDVAKGLEKTYRAVQTLNDGKAKESLALLRDAVGSFEVALAADPNLTLVPVNSVVTQQQLYTSPEALKREILYAKDLLAEGKIQEARRTLLPLRSDIAVQTTYLPMNTYPDAIRAAIKALVAEKDEEAKTVLAGAMNTLFVSEAIAAPVPLLTAKLMVDKADGLDKSKKEEIIANLATAREQLEVARLLGYLTEDSRQYEEISDRIKKLMADVQGGNSVSSKFAELKDAISKWLPWSIK
jgi:hypothetical protein